MSAARVRRPAGVTFLVVLLWIQALLSMAGGIILILLRHNHSVIRSTHTTSSNLLAFGIAALVVGLITAAIASGIGRGSNFVRWVVALISLLHLAGAIYGLDRLHGDSRVGTIADGIIALIVLYILFGERGSQEFFTGRR